MIMVIGDKKMEDKKRHWWHVKIETDVVADNPTEALEKAKENAKDWKMCDFCVKLAIEK